MCLGDLRTKNIINNSCLINFGIQFYPIRRSIQAKQDDVLDTTSAPATPPRYFAFKYINMI